MEGNLKANNTGSDKVFTIINYTFATLFFLAVLYPLINVVSSSFSSPEALISGKVWLFPVGFSLEGYKAVLAYKNVWLGYGNSLFYTVFGTLLNVAVTVIAAYPLSRKDFRGRNIIMFVFTFTMLFSGGMIPSYLLVKSLGLMNSRLALIIPGAMSVYNVIVVRTFFTTNISDELLESAKLDGCSDFRFLASIVLPLSGAVIAVITLWYSVGHWNGFFDALLYLTDKNKYPLQIFLREILLLNTVDELSANLVEESKRIYMSELLKYALIIVATLPLLIMYPVVQKYFVKGVMVGSIKG